MFECICLKPPWHDTGCCYRLVSLYRDEDWCCHLMICHERQATRSELPHAYCSCQNLVKNVKIGELNCAFWDNYTPSGYCIISDRKYQELRQINSELWMLNFTIQRRGMREEMTRWLRRLNSIKEYRWDTSPWAAGEVSNWLLKCWDVWLSSDWELRWEYPGDVRCQSQEIGPL